MWLNGNNLKNLLGDFFLGLYLNSLINDHFLAYVSVPRFVNPIFYSLANFV